MGCAFMYTEYPYKEQQWVVERFSCYVSYFPPAYVDLYECTINDPTFPYMCVSQLINHPECPASGCER